MRQLFTIGFAAFAMVFAGIVIVLETNKGTLTIKSEANDVPIRIVQGKDIVERLTVLKSGTMTRLKAGEYTVEIDAPNSDLEIVNNRVSLSRGKNEIVKIVLGSAAVSPLSQAVMDQSLQSAREQGGWPSIETAQAGRTQEVNRARLQSLNGKWEFQSVESDRVVTQYQIPIELMIEENQWTVSNNTAGGNRFEVNGSKLTLYGFTSTGNSSGIGDEPSIAYGIYELNGDTITYAMTAFFPASWVKLQPGIVASPSFQHPEGFDTKGNSNRTYRLRRSNRNLGEPDDPEQPLLGKTLQQLQGKWQLKRQIAADETKKSRRILPFGSSKVIASSCEMAGQVAQCKFRSMTVTRQCMLSCRWKLRMNPGLGL